MLDRMERNREQFPVFHDWPVHSYLTGGRILVGCEGNDPSLPYLVERIGCEAFAYSSDYPHEVDMIAARHEIKETMQSPKLTSSQKAAVLGGNARRFFKLGDKVPLPRSTLHAGAI
jgi:predicted TIM-barrel fold metal-dependent hydrolase